jgi:hypothetical protein
MDPRESAASLAQNIAHMLDHDCLQELFSRCSTSDLAALRRTCRLFAQLLGESQLVWGRRLWVDFGMRLALGPSAAPGSLHELASRVYQAPSDTPLRFQGVLVNGSVDGLNMWYWVDNLFKADRSYFCSDASANVDCLALLLDGDVPRETQYRQVRRYMERRCRYAASLFEQLHHPGEPGDVERLMSLVETWSDQQLEHFFESLVDNLQENNALSRLLFYDIPQDRVELEEGRLRGVATFLKDRLKPLKQGLVELPGDLHTLFDASVLDKLGPECPTRTVGVIRELNLNRAGSLTCPVSAGVVLAGVVDHAQLAGLAPREAAEALQAATQVRPATAFNDLDTWEAVEEAMATGALPRMNNYSKTYTGTVCEFDASWREGDFNAAWLRPRGDGGAPLVTWRPLVWFKFHSREEAEQIVAGGQQQAPAEEPAPQPVAMEPSTEAGEPSAEAGLSVAMGYPVDGVEKGGSSTASEEEEEEEEGDEGEGELEDVDVDDDGVNLDHTTGRNHLHVKLAQPVTANILMVKLIAQENLMEELMDGHAYPNIDMTVVEVLGKKVVLPQGVNVKPAGP